MAKELKVAKDYYPDLCDSDTGKSLLAEKVVDITEDCPNGNKKDRFLLLYTRAERGRIVQITSPHDGEKYMGMHIHFFVDEIECEMNVAPRNDTFGMWARMMGFDKPALRIIIEAYAPRP